MNAKKLIAGLVMTLTMALVGCGPTDPKDPKDPVITAESFTEAATDMFKEQIQAGKFVLTCCGYEGMDNAQTWIEDFGYTSVETLADVTDPKDFACAKLLDLTTIPEGYVVILGVGYTGKGLGSATTTKEAEQQRAVEIAELKSSGHIAGLVLVEVAGSANRGEVADGLLNTLLPVCDAVVAKTSVNKENFLSNARTTYGFECCTGDTATPLKAALKQLGF